MQVWVSAAAVAAVHLLQLPDAVAAAPTAHSVPCSAPAHGPSGLSRIGPVDVEGGRQNE